MGGVLHGAVRPKGDLRRDPEIEVLAEPVPHEAARALESLEGLRPLVLGPQHGYVDAGELEVRRGVHLGYRDEAQARILDLPLQDGGDLLPDELIDALEPLPLHSTKSPPGCPSRSRPRCPRCSRAPWR